MFGIVSCDTCQAKGYFEVDRGRHCANLLPILTKYLFPEGVHIQEAESAWMIFKFISINLCGDNGEDNKTL